jgi:tetratricopeptide (TPR) repeat protein
MRLQLAVKTSTLLFVVSLTAASAADQSVWDECTHARDSDASIAACTKILQGADETTSNRAIAYYARAGAYKTKGDNDQAIVDYTKAIEANSHYADAYAGRGIAYQIRAITTMPSLIIRKRSKSIRGTPMHMLAEGWSIGSRAKATTRLQTIPKPSRSIRAM